MKIETSSVTRRTHRIVVPLRAVPPSGDTGRGIYYRPQCDEVAAEEARRRVGPAIDALRAKVGQKDAPVEWHVDRDGDGLVAIVAIVQISRS